MTTEPTVTSAELRELVDKQQIRDLLMRYARGVDRDDWELVKACFTPDATDDHGVVKGSIDNLVTQASAALAPFRGSMHMMCQQYIEVDGDTARGEVYALTSRIQDAAEGDGEEETFSGLRYVDRYVRKEGEWKIAERVTTLEWCTTVASRPWLPMEMFTHGQRNRDDVSYKFGLV
jgi:SnoaL-like domain